jgi:hypothetical protein
MHKIGLIFLIVFSFNVASEETSPVYLEIPKGTAKLGLLLQNWLIYDEKNTVDRSNFRLRRSEIKISGNIQKDISWTLMIDPAKSLKTGTVIATNDNKVIQDFILSYTFLDQFEFSVGQFKIPTTAEGLLSSANLILPERSIVGRTYGDKRDPSIRLSFKNDNLKFISVLSNGNTPNTDDINSEKNLYLRAEYSPYKGISLGSFFGVVDSYFHKNKWGANLFWDYNNESFHFEYVHEASSNTANVKRSSGYTIDLAHSFTPEFQGVFRYENILFVRSADIESNASTIGINYYFKESNSKIQFASVFLNNMTGTNGSYDVSSTEISASELFLFSFQVSF